MSTDEHTSISKRTFHSLEEANCTKTFKIRVQVGATVIVWSSETVITSRSFCYLRLRRTNLGSHVLPRYKHFYDCVHYLTPLALVHARACSLPPSLAENSITRPCWSTKLAWRKTNGTLRTSLPVRRHFLSYSQATLTPPHAWFDSPKIFDRVQFNKRRWHFWWRCTCRNYSQSGFNVPDEALRVRLAAFKRPNM